MQEKVLAQIEELHKKNPPKAKVAKEVPLATKEGAAVPEQAEEEEADEEEDPVEAALNKYGIITENPWEKGVK